jgi:hypothetical protein
MDKRYIYPRRRAKAGSALVLEAAALDSKDGG